MKKASLRQVQSEKVRYFLKDVQILCALPTSKKLDKLTLDEYPFDNQLLTASRIYRESRKLYLSLGGNYTSKVCSTMRALSAQDLFKDEISFTPSLTELLWFKDHFHEVSDPEQEVEALVRFNEISIFHEQNHRVIWRLLPPAPNEERDLCRYLNFAESLVVILDLALGDELGSKNSYIFERMKVIYRSSGSLKFKNKSKEEYRRYLLSLFATTYYALETIHYDDILAAVDFILPNQKTMNKQAVQRGLEISELFTRVTNPHWQERYWKTAGNKLRKIHSKSKADALYLPEDPLHLAEEFYHVRKVFAYYGL